MAKCADSKEAKCSFRRILESQLTEKIVYPKFEQWDHVKAKMKDIADFIIKEMNENEETSEILRKIERCENRFVRYQQLQNIAREIRYGLEKRVSMGVVIDEEDASELLYEILPKLHEFAETDA